MAIILNRKVNSEIKRQSEIINYNVNTLDIFYTASSNIHNISGSCG